MEGRIIEDDGIAGGEFRDERLSQPLEEEVPVAVAGENNGSQQSAAFQSCDQIDALARGAASGLECFATLSLG